MGKNSSLICQNGLNEINEQVAVCSYVVSKSVSKGPSKFHNLYEFHQLMSFDKRQMLY